MSVDVNPHAGVKTGRKRQTYRIKEWMDTKEIRQADVAEKAGVKSHSVVSRTIRGSANNRNILKALKDLGCPKSYLALPVEMENAQES